MIPARYAPVLFGFFLSCLMSFIVSGIATVRSVGLGQDMLDLWIGSWLTSWFFSFPIVLVVAPLARRMVAKLVRAD